MLANPSISVRIRVASLLAVGVSELIIVLVKESFDRFCLDREGADHRDAKLVTACRSHIQLQAVQAIRGQRMKIERVVPLQVHVGNT
jgi:hypothetical protein